MMQFLSDVIDQLDLALDQLAIGERNFDRFALMLIDNVVELTLHNHAQKASYEIDLWGKNEEPKYDLKSLQKALGQNFDVKVKFAKKTGYLDTDKCESILNLHSFRNTSYHKGQRHEGILHSLALFYFFNACELLRDFSPLFWSQGSNDVITHRARKYLGSIEFLKQKESFKFAFERLNEVAKSLDCELVDDLHTDMQSTIDEMDWNIQFISANGPDNKSRDKIILESQAWNIAFTDEAKAYAKNNNCPEKTIQGYVSWLADNYPWSIKTDPIPSWRKRLESLESETNLHIGLKKYCDFMRQTDKLRSQINESAHQLDSHIQEQVDYLRGK